MPRSAWMVTAVAGKVWSGVEVARTMRSISSGFRPASSSAARAAAVPMVEVSSPLAAIRRSLMPVRVTINSSVVSTTLAKTSLVKMRFCKYPPHPLTTVRNTLTGNYSRGVSRRTIKLELGVEASNIGGKALHHAARRHVVGGVDGGGEARCVGPAVALHDNAVQPEENAAVQLARVHLLLEGTKGALGQRGAGASEKRPPHGCAKIFADLLSGSLGGLQGDVAGEAVGDHDVRSAVADFVALDKTAKFDRQQRVLERGIGGLDPVQSFDLLHADIEEANGRPLHAEQRPRHGRAHQSKFDELAGVGADIGADIEHDALGLDGGPEHSYRRAVNTLDGLEAKLGHGHQRPGIAGGHCGVGASLAHRLEAQPHARMPAPFAQRLTRLRIHGHRNIGVQDLAFGGECLMVLELGVDAGSVADQEEAGVGMADERDRRARDDHAWSMVATHGVERYGDWSSHATVPYRKERRC